MFQLLQLDIRGVGLNCRGIVRQREQQRSPFLASDMRTNMHTLFTGGSYYHGTCFPRNLEHNVRVQQASVLPTLRSVKMTRTLEWKTLRPDFACIVSNPLTPGCAKSTSTIHISLATTFVHLGNHSENTTAP